MLKTPDITKAQAVSSSGWVVAQLVAWGVLSGAHEQTDISIGATAIVVGWHIADAIIRHGRARGSTTTGHETVVTTQSGHGGISSVQPDTTTTETKAAPPLPKPSAPHVFVEKGIGIGRVER